MRARHNKYCNCNCISADAYNPFLSVTALRRERLVIDMATVKPSTPPIKSFVVLKFALVVPVLSARTLQFVLDLFLVCVCSCLCACRDRREVLRCWCWVWTARARRVFFSALRRAARSRKWRPLGVSMPSLSTGRGYTSSSWRVRAHLVHTARLKIAPFMLRCLSSASQMFRRKSLLNALRVIQMGNMRSYESHL